MIAALLLAAASAAHAEPFHDARLAFEQQDYAQAAKLFEPLAAEGDDLAQTYLGWLFENGKGEDKDFERAAELYNSAAKQGSGWAELLLAADYDEGRGVAKDPVQAVDWAKKAVEHGVIEGCGRVGMHYYEGKGVAQDGKEALKWWEKGAAGGDLSSTHDLGSLYGKGEVVSRDVDKSVEYLRKGKADGVDNAYYDMLERFRKSPDNPDDAMMRYGLLYPYAGEPSLPSEGKALAWFRRQAEAGDQYAQYAVAAAYEGGVGMPKDLEEAANWYAKAAAQGHERAENNLNALAKAGRITSKQLAAARTNAKPAPAVASGAAASAAPEQNGGPSSDIDAPSFKLKERPHDVALVVGIENYKNLPAAKWAERDAEAARRTFVALGVPERNVIALTGENATRSKIQAYLQEWLPKNVRPDSRVFVYYSGHGAPDAETKQAYLVPWDADTEFLQSTAYPLHDFYGALGRLKAKSVVVALDACFSGLGASGRSVFAAGARPLVTKVETAVPAGITVLAAASSEQLSNALDEQGHGLFTYYLLKGLDGAAKDKAGRVTAGSLLDYAGPKVGDEARHGNRGQTPTLAGDSASVLAQF